MITTKKYNNFLETEWSGQRDVVNEFYGWIRSGLNNSKVHLELMQETGPYGPDWCLRATDVGNGIDSGIQLMQKLLFLDVRQKYRFTIWVKPKWNIKSGEVYLGIENSSKVTPMSTNTRDTNPYFISGYSGNQQVSDEWLLFTGYIKPHTSITSSVVESKIYRRNGQILNFNTKDFKFMSDSPHLAIRFLPLYYSTPGDSVLWTHPRLEIVDGNEPSISQILNSKIT